MYSAERLQRYKQDALNMPNTDLVGQEMIVLNGSAQLLGTKADMDDVIRAIMKVYENREHLNSIP
ncbi:hypothetical protein D3C87_1391290 [compost metagenome]